MKKLEEERKKLQSEKEAVEDRQKVLKRRVEVLDEIVAQVLISFLLKDRYLSYRNLLALFPIEVFAILVIYSAKLLARLSRPLNETVSCFHS